jgi:hypothetical protein
MDKAMLQAQAKDLLCHTLYPRPEKNKKRKEKVGRH